VTWETAPEGAVPNHPDEPTNQQSSRSKATGDEAANLVEARLKVDAVCSVLAHVALEHVSVDGAILPMVKMLDDAVRLVERS
jgi:hypothetical protein